MVRTINHPDQLPLILPDSDWEPPTELPDLRRVPIMAQDLECKDEGLARNIGPGWPYRLGYVCGVAYAVDGRQGYIPLRGEKAFEKDSVARWLKDHNHVPTIFHNAPFDCGWRLTDLGVPPPDEVHDTQCMTVMLDENRLTYNLDDVCEAYGIPGKDKRLLNEAAAAYGIKRTEVMENLWRLPNKYVGPYAEGDAVSTLNLGLLLLEKIRAVPDLYDAYFTDVSLIPMVVEMRRRGIRVDVLEAERIAAEIDARAQDMLAELGHRLALGRPMEFTDIMSGQRLSRYFDQEGVPYPKTSNKKKGKKTDESEGQGYSFESSWMADHPHWLPQTVAKIRSSRDASQKFLRNYICDFANRGRIHAEIHPYRSDEGGTRSHRFSYSDPPLQQMPGDRLADLKKLVRGVFLPEDEEYWLAADYSQQEPRILVHYACETGVLGWEKAHDYYHNDPAPDYHTMVSKLTGLPRPQAKIINLSLMYGMGIALLCARLGLSLSEGQRVIDTYHREMPIVKGLGEKCSNAASSRGYIKLIDGARCHFDAWELQRMREGERWKTNTKEKALVDWAGRPIRRSFTHKAMNRLVQGSAARQTKKAMLALWREKIVPILQMHDELDFSIDNAQIVAHIVEVMRDIVPLKVPMKVDAEFGKTWGKAVNKNWDMRDAA